MRFTLGKMFLAIAMLALACAGMMHRNTLWTNCVISITFVMFALILVRAAGLRGRALVQSITFPLIGGAYLLVVESHFGEGLLTNEPLGLAARSLNIPGTPRGSGPVQFNVDQIIRQGMQWDSNGWNMPEPELHNFFLIGHCVFSWIFAVLAAWFAGRMYDRRERSTKGTP
jgi:hypothetical protein